MDDKLFKQLLSQVADWQIPKLTETDLKLSKQSKRGRGRPTNEEQYQQAHEEIFLDLYNGINPTHPPQLLKLKNCSQICRDCGKECPNGHHKEKKLYEANKKRHWREKCVTCGLFQNPYTGKFDLPPGKSSVIWNSYVRDTKGVYNSKGNRAKEDAGIITFYPNGKPTE